MIPPKMSPRPARWLYRTGHGNGLQVSPIQALAEMGANRIYKAGFSPQKAQEAQVKTLP
jgi:hypothetical protein